MQLRGLYIVREARWKYKEGRCAMSHIVGNVSLLTKLGVMHRYFQVTLGYRFGL
jgi:hypothetical protein